MNKLQTACALLFLASTHSAYSQEKVVPLDIKHIQTVKGNEIVGFPSEYAELPLYDFTKAPSYRTKKKSPSHLTINVGVTEHLAVENDLNLYGQWLNATETGHVVFSEYNELGMGFLPSEALRQYNFSLFEPKVAETLNLVNTTTNDYLTANAFEKKRLEKSVRIELTPKLLNIPTIKDNAGKSFLVPIQTSYEKFDFESMSKKFYIGSCSTLNGYKLPFDVNKEHIIITDGFKDAVASKNVNYRCGFEFKFPETDKGMAAAEKLEEMAVGNLAVYQRVTTTGIMYEGKQVLKGHELFFVTLKDKKLTLEKTIKPIASKASLKDLIANYMLSTESRKYYGMKKLGSSTMDNVMLMLKNGEVFRGSSYTFFLGEDNLIHVINSLGSYTEYSIHKIGATYRLILEGFTNASPMNAPVPYIDIASYRNIIFTDDALEQLKPLNDKKAAHRVITEGKIKYGEQFIKWSPEDTSLLTPYAQGASSDSKTNTSTTRTGKLNVSCNIEAYESTGFFTKSAFTAKQKISHPADVVIDRIINTETANKDAVNEIGERGDNWVQIKQLAGKSYVVSTYSIKDGYLNASVKLPSGVNATDSMFKAGFCSLIDAL